MDSIAALGYRLLVPTPEKFDYGYFRLAAVACVTATALLGALLALKISPGLFCRLSGRPLLLVSILIGGSITLRMIGLVSDLAPGQVVEGIRIGMSLGELINKSTWECLYLILILALSVLLRRLQPASSPEAVG